MFQFKVSMIFLCANLNKILVMITLNTFDPKEKKENEPIEEVQNEDAVFLVNDDGTDFDSSERTYVSVELPEEDDTTKKD